MPQTPEQKNEQKKWYDWSRYDGKRVKCLKCGHRADDHGSHSKSCYFGGERGTINRCRCQVFERDELMEAIEEIRKEFK